LPKEIVDLALKYRCKSISYTYNEPIVYFEYTYDTAKIAKEAGLKNIYVTSGYETTKAIDYLSGVIDGFNIDLKSFSDNFYKKICNASLKPVLKAIEYSYKKGIFIEITTLLIPDENDSEEEIRKIARFIASIDTSIPWHISRFYPTYKMSNKNLTSLKTLLRAYEIGKEEGLKYVYIGNLNAPEYETTYCPNCNFSVIKRSGHLGERVENHLKNGKCPKCSTNIFGVWE
jgi:pyruvate formate lyase activating enzyme